MLIKKYLHKGAFIFLNNFCYNNYVLVYLIDEISCGAIYLIEHQFLANNHTPRILERLPRL